MEPKHVSNFINILSEPTYHCTAGLKDSPAHSPSVSPATSSAASLTFVFPETSALMLQVTDRDLT